MLRRRTTLTAVIAAALFALTLASAASAQSRDPRWGRDDDYRRDRDRDHRRDDGYYDRGRYGGYDERTLRDLAQRIKDRSHSLERSVDRFLDRSRVDGTRREDQINDGVRNFRRAADDFRSNVGNGRDLNRSADEARRLVGSANGVDRMLSRLRVDSRTYSDWREIERDLSHVANIYGINYRGDDGYRRGGYDDRYDPRYPDDRTRRNGDGWWRRIPDVINGRRP